MADVVPQPAASGNWIRPTEWRDKPPYRHLAANDVSRRHDSKSEALHDGTWCGRCWSAR